MDTNYLKVKSTSGMYHWLNISKIVDIVDYDIDMSRVYTMDGRFVETNSSAVDIVDAIQKFEQTANSKIARHELDRISLRKTMEEADRAIESSRELLKKIRNN